MNEAEKYLAKMRASVDDVKEMISLLERRIELGNIEMQTKSEYEANEIQIHLIKTTREIQSLQNLYNEKLQYYEKYSKEFLIDYEDCENNFDRIIDIARKKQREIGSLYAIMSRMDFNKVTSNIQTKITIYKKIKSILDA
jgi:hypothetical protein